MYHSIAYGNELASANLKGKKKLEIKYEDFI